MNRIDRLLGYLLILQSRQLVRAQDLAARFEVSERTVYRDMEALVEVGVPVVGTAGEGYRLMAGYSLPPIMFTEAESQGLYLAIALLRGLTRKGATRQAVESALEKVEAILPSVSRKRLQTLQNIMSFYAVGSAPLDLDDERFVELQRAIDQHQIVYLHYHASHSNEISAREIEPLHLAYVDRIWLVHGYCRLRQDYRNFRLDRIDHLVVRRETFTPRPIQLRRQPAQTVRVLVRFDATIVRWVREAQPLSFLEEVAETEEGDVMMAYEVASLAQIARWLLGWGEEMEVLEPAELRNLLADMARQVAARHG